MNNSFCKVLTISSEENRVCKRLYKKIHSIFGSIEDSQICDLLNNVNNEKGLTSHFIELANDKGMSVSDMFDRFIYLARMVYPLKGKLRKFLFIKQNPLQNRMESNDFHHNKKRSKKCLVPYTAGI
jgi:hypothetical protein